MTGTDLTRFEFDGYDVRTVLIEGEPWFVAADVVAVLGYRMASDAARRLDDDERGTHSVRTRGGEQQMVVVNESGLYSLILGSKLADSKRFKRWVTSEVLPAIRKTGSYGTVRELTRLELIDLARESEVARLKAVEERDSLAGQVAELEAPARSWRHLADASGDYSLREAAQILDRDPAIRTGQNRLSKWLKNFGWTDQRGIPYQRHVEAGRLYLRTYTDRQDVARTQVRITVKGLHDIHREMGGSGPLLLGVATA